MMDHMTFGKIAKYADVNEDVRDIRSKEPVTQS